MSRKPEIYVKLFNGTWVKIIGKIQRTVKSRRGKQAISYTLLGESLDDQPSINDKPVGSIYVSSGSVTKYLMKILEYGFSKPIVVEPYKPEIYRVKAYDKAALKLLAKIAEEMNIIRHPRKRKETSKSSSRQ